MKRPSVTMELTALNVVGIVTANAPPNAGRENTIDCVLLKKDDPVMDV